MNNATNTALEARSVLREIELLFQDNKDAKNIEKIKSLLLDIKERQALNERNAKEITTSLFSELNKSDVQLKSALRSKEEHDVKLVQLQKNKQNKEVKVADYENKIKELKHTNKQTEIKEEQLQSTEKQIIQDTDSSKSKLQNNISLYLNITNLHWNNLTDRVSGHISSPDSYVPFDFDASEHSKFEIANSLWDLIDS